jgi:hypothetical protein
MITVEVFDESNMRLVARFKSVAAAARGLGLTSAIVQYRAQTGSPIGGLRLRVGNSTAGTAGTAGQRQGAFVDHEAVADARAAAKRAADNARAAAWVAAQRAKDERAAAKREPAHAVAIAAYDTDMRLLARYASISAAARDLGLADAVVKHRARSGAAVGGTILRFENPAVQQAALAREAARREAAAQGRRTGVDAAAASAVAIALGNKHKPSWMTR